MESSSPFHSKLPSPTDTIFMGCPAAAAALEPNFQVDDLLDFPNEDVDNDDTEATLGSPLIPHATAAGGSLLFTPPLAAASIQTNKEEATLHEELSHGLCVPPDDLFHQLEWLSSFNEDNFFPGGDAKPFSATTSSSRASAGPTRTCKDAPVTVHRVRDDFRSESPVSVLEHGGHAYALKHHVQRASRIRKARTGGRVWSLDILKPILFENRLKASYDNNSLLVTSYSLAYSEPLCSFLQPEESERPYKKMKQVGANDATIDFAFVRKCMHCSVQKTPQWRAGPMGPKTLCNACGVRYKSGRLVPEYRPAASPSFLNEVHSNSHRRILEMRRVKTVEPSVKHYKSKVQTAFKRRDLKRESWIVPHISDEHTCKETHSSKENGQSCVEISACKEAEGGVCNKGLYGKEDSCGVRTVLCEANVAFDEAGLHKAPNSSLACKEKHIQENACASNMHAVYEGELLCGKDTNADMYGLDTHPPSHKIEARVQNDEEKIGVYVTQ